MWLREVVIWLVVTGDGHRGGNREIMGGWGAGRGVVYSIFGPYLVCLQMRVSLGNNSFHSLSD